MEATIPPELPTNAQSAQARRLSHEHTCHLWSRDGRQEQLTERKGETHRCGLFVVVAERVSGKDDRRRDTRGNPADDDEHGKVEDALAIQS